MVMVKIFGMLEEDTFIEYGALKIGDSKELMSIDGQEFLSGSLYDGVLSKKGLLSYARRLVRLLLERTEEAKLLGSTLSINLEDMCTNKFTLESDSDEEVLNVTLSELNVYDSYVSVTESGETYISGLVIGEDNVEVEIYLSANVAVNLPDPVRDDVSLVDVLVNRSKLEGQTSSKVAFNSFAVGLGMTCVRTSYSKKEALDALEKAYILAKNVIDELNP